MDLSLKGTMSNIDILLGRSSAMLMGLDPNADETKLGRMPQTLLIDLIDSQGIPAPRSFMAISIMKEEDLEALHDLINWSWSHEALKTFWQGKMLSLAEQGGDE